jgi:putative ABC transport system permease protein
MHFTDLIWKNLLRRPARSLLTASGVMVATAAVVSLLSVAAALENRSAEVYHNRGIDVVVIRAGVTERLTSNLDESLEQHLAKLPGVADVAPALTDMVLFHGQGILGVPLCGWRRDSFLFELLQTVEGRPLAAEDSHGVMLGSVLAENLSKHAGDEIEIEGAMFRIVGIFRSVNVWENGSAMIMLADMQELMDRPGQVTEFQIRMQPDALAQEGAAEALCRRIEELADETGRGLGLSAMPTAEHVSSNARIALVHALAWITAAIALVIGSIGMLNTMMMALLERTQEIGTLRAMGWQRLRIVRMILSESLVLSLLGAAAGMLAAWSALAVLRQIPAVRVTIMPEVTLLSIVAAVALTLLFGVVGGSYPAYRGANLLPAEAIHDE